MWTDEAVFSGPCSSKAVAVDSNGSNLEPAGNQKKVLTCRCRTHQDFLVKVVVGAGFEPANGHPNGFTVRAL